MDGSSDSDRLSAITRLMGDGDLKGAMEAASAMLRDNPQNAPALHMMGLVAAKMGDQGLALSFAERAHQIEPDFREYPAMLAYLCASVGRVSDALYYAKLAMVLAPHPLSALLMSSSIPMGREVFDHIDVSTHRLLAEAAYYAGRYADAVQEGEAELRVNPDQYETMITLACAQHALGQNDLARARLRAAIQSQPETAEAHRWMGDVLLALGDHAAGLASHRTALTLEAEDDSVAAAHVLSQLPWQGNVDQDFTADVAAHARGEVKPSQVKERGPYIGILWDGCHAGPLVDFVLPVLEHMDETILYRLNRRTDPVTELARSRVMRFLDCPDLDPATFNRIVAGDAPCVLVNLCSSAEEARFPSFAGPGAPLTVQWLGDPLADRLPGAELVVGSPATAAVDRALFGDQVIELPQLLAWRFPATGAAVEAVTPLPRDKNGQVTFGAVGDMRRITPDTAALWASVLRAVPGATLLIGCTSQAWPQSVMERLHGLFANFGVVGRVNLQGPQPPSPVNFDLFSRADVMLDTWPVNGLNDVAEALWMGVPVVTLGGPGRAGRTGAAILEAAGRQSWIAESDMHYVEIAAALAGAEDLAATRSGLRDATAAAPLCDAKGFAAQLKTALQTRPLRSANAA